MSFQRLLNFVGRNLPKTAAQVAPGAAYSSGFALLGGGGLGQAAIYGAGDLGANISAVLAAKALGSKIKNPVLGVQPQTLRGGLENVANIAGSMGSNMAITNMLYGDQYSQLAQIQQQMEQRSTVNTLPLQQQQVSPGTMYQTAGLPNPEEFETLLNQLELNNQNIQNQFSLGKYLKPQELAMLQGDLMGAL